MNTYAVHGSPEFNQTVDGLVRRIGNSVRETLGGNFAALVLGGGYGRGEGGVLFADGREKLYNDLDFTLVVKRRSVVPESGLREISNRYHSECSVDVDFSRPLTERDIRRWPHWLMWTELLNGHIVVNGDRDILSRNAPAHIANCPPPVEATRLLLNRGAGLIWALRVRRGHEQAPDPDFVRRNYHKCVMALGDALLIVSRRHRTAYHGRADELATLLSDDPSLATLKLVRPYQRALGFRALPGPAEPEAFSTNELEELADLWCSVFLIVEERRTGKQFPSPQQYAVWRGLREPDQHRIGQLPRNLMRNLQDGRFSLRYPREELYRHIPALLTGQAGNGWKDQSAGFLTSWSRYN